MKRFDWAALSAAERRAALARPENRRDPRVIDTVRTIFAEIEAEGATALDRWSERLDGAPCRALELRPATVDAARARLSAEDLSALETAAANVTAFHAVDRPASGPEVAPVEGVALQRVWRPIATAGLYVPGGTAPLFSSLIMLAIPAAAAGVANRAVVTPPQKGGEAHPAMIAAAALCGLERLFLVGGAQAIAALTFGVGDVPRADKLFGPGNAYVAEAKRLAADLPGGPSIDMPAGPSELLVIADASTDPDWIAADLLSQAEHDADAQVVLVTPEPSLVDRVEAALERQLSDLPRAAVARRALEQARAIVVRDLAEAASASDAYAPEHLSVQVEDPDALTARLSAAGTVFVGRWSAETFGDYVSGPSHVLPTDGAARTWSGVSVQSFMKSFVVQRATARGAAALAPAAARLARMEGLEAHARAADLRAAS